MNKNFKGETLTEVLISTVIAALLLASAMGAFLIVKNVINYSIAEYNLQRDAGIIINRVTRNIEELSSAYGLRSGASFTIPSVSEIDYVDTLGNTRKYYLSGNSIIYENMAIFSSQQTLYSANPDVNITLRFWEPYGYGSRETVGLYISLVQQIGSRTVSGSASTYVNLRNIPK